jgi:oligopeptide transport system permease protein
MGLLLFLCIFLFAIVGPWLSGYSYDEIHLDLANHPPGPRFWFGSDDLGRDLFTRVCFGARISLFVGISAAFIDMGIGILWGALAGFAGGKLDHFMMRLADILYSLPYLLVVILLLVISGPGLFALIVAMALLGWINMARIVRGQVMQIKQQDFVLAAISLGAKPRQVLFRHILPNAVGPIIVTVTMTIPSAIFAEAFLSFLGLGVQAPIASWGTMASEGFAVLSYYPWPLFFPALFISSTILAFNLIGDGLSEAFDTKID